MVQVIESMKPGAMAHQLYLEASDVYSYPTQPQKLQFCPDCRTYIVKGVENEIMYHYVNEVGRNMNNNAAIDSKLKLQYKKSSNARKLVFGVSDQVRHKPACSHRSRLEAWIFRFKKKRNCTIQGVKTKTLISFPVTANLISTIVFAQAKMRFFMARLKTCPCNIQSFYSSKNWKFHSEIIMIF